MNSTVDPDPRIPGSRLRPAAILKQGFKHLFGRGSQETPAASPSHSRHPGLLPRAVSLWSVEPAPHGQAWVLAQGDVTLTISTAHVDSCRHNEWCFSCFTTNTCTYVTYIHAHAYTHAQTMRSVCVSPRYIQGHWCTQAVANWQVFTHAHGSDWCLRPAEGASYTQMRGIESLVVLKLCIHIPSDVHLLSQHTHAPPRFVTLLEDKVDYERTEKGLENDGRVELLPCGDMWEQQQYQKPW